MLCSSSNRRIQAVKLPGIAQAFFFCLLNTPASGGYHCYHHLLPGQHSPKMPSHSWGLYLKAFYTLGKFWVTFIRSSWRAWKSDAWLGAEGFSSLFPWQSPGEIGNFWWQITACEERCLKKITQIAFPPLAMEPKVNWFRFCRTYLWKYLYFFERNPLWIFCIISENTHESD